MVLKCARESCPYEKHPDEKNNGGRYCCQSCKKNLENHGAACKKTTVYYKAKRELHGFLENNLIKSFYGLKYTYDDNNFIFENKEEIFAGLKTLCEIADGEEASNNIVLPIGTVLENTSSIIKLRVGNVTHIILRKMVLRDEGAYYFVLSNSFKEIPNSYGRKLYRDLEEM
jgi:hypothetical protein